MINAAVRFSFAEVNIRSLFLVLILLVCGKLYAQDRKADGVVFDKDSKERIAKVNIINTRTGESIYNNLQAEFHINARSGDHLIFSKPNYLSDTITVSGTGSIAVYLKPTGVMLRQVDIHDTIKTPQKQLEATKREYSKVYGSLADRDLLSVSPYGGAGLSIDGIWNSLSRSGRNAAHLREIIQRDYQQDIIDYRFNKALVSRITGLTEPRLTDFMQRYRPGYYIVTTTNDYEFIQIIRNNYRRYMRNPRALGLQALPHVKAEDEKE
ncbi:hypothetical protein [Mucilaginibacter sp. KACC 22063]|uniref:hypothetical protein n=1 Tax=Mucilaginibacter sp. KACC 22063 TaxID=3025666 RepID=UPI00236540E3|nr:hypothetical protein [Mucilaginibacter sp. KACC 22063]WDF55526.1 hypothetical protein PQ461_00445 [Mucilaginibacter sp. KACC 22063]